MVVSVCLQEALVWQAVPFAHYSLPEKNTKIFTIFALVAYPSRDCRGAFLFSYTDLLKEMQLFARHGVETGIVGDSETGQQIPYVFVGKKNGNNMIVLGAIHAREHLTALVTLCLAKYLVKHSDLPIYGGIYFVPMVNPDGVRLCQEGVGFVGDKQRKANLIAVNGGSTDFSLWKANADGVDLNVNFDAKWGEGRQNVFFRAPSNYVGKAPFSAKETRAVKQFTEFIKPVVTLSYHLKGEEIYWDFGQVGERRNRDFALAASLAKYTGYVLVDDRGSTGGYKDWCVSQFGIPSFTVEVGNDKFSHPFPYSELRTILAQNEDLPRRLLNSVVAYNADNG